MNTIKQSQASLRRCLRLSKFKIEGRSHRNYSSSDADGKLPAITRFIDSFSHYKEKWSERNTLHTKAVEQAGYDRNLFNSSTRKRRVVDLKFPEIFNTGSPFNVVAGQGPRNMDALVAHYTKMNADEEERKLTVLRNKTK